MALSLDDQVHVPAPKLRKNLNKETRQPETLVTSAFVGVVALSDVRPYTRADSKLLNQKRAIGGWSPGQFSWVLKKPIRFAHPIKAKSGGPSRVTAALLGGAGLLLLNHAVPPAITQPCRKHTTNGSGQVPQNGRTIPLVFRWHLARNARHGLVLCGCWTFSSQLRQELMTVQHGYCPVKKCVICFDFGSQKQD